MAPGALDLQGVRSIAGDLGVLLEHRWSTAAGTSYLMNVCACGKTSGDNFLYGGAGGDTPVRADDAPVRRFVVCADGHWSPLSPRVWLPGVAPSRRAVGVGLTGTTSGLFTTDPERSGPRLDANSISISEMTSRMFGGWG